MNRFTFPPQLARLLAIVTVVGLGLGVGADLLLGRLLKLPDGATVAAVPGPEPEVEPANRPVATPQRTRPRPATEASYVDVIVERNLFDPDAVRRPGELDPEQLIDGVKSDLPVRLLATLVAIPEEYSSALIAETRGQAKALGYGKGDKLLDEAIILKIEHKIVWVERNGRTEYLSMTEEGPDRPASAQPNTRTDDDDASITTDGARTVVDKSTVEDALANIDQLATQIRVVPHKDANGNVDGYRLSAIRRGSLFDKLGIKNGDIVHAVNGLELTSTQGAMQAYESLKSEAEFTFDVTRRGRRQTFEFEIR